MTMLDRMRRHKGWLKWSLALVVLTFVVFYIPDFLTSSDRRGAERGPGRGRGRDDHRARVPAPLHRRSCRPTATPTARR